MITTVKKSSVVQGFPKYRSMLAGNSAYIPSSYESIATASGTGSSDTITFSSIPSTFKHLQVRGKIRNATVNGNQLQIRVNGDTGANYASHYLAGTGAAANAAGNTGLSYWYYLQNIGVPNSAGLFDSLVFDLLDYGSTSKYKTARSFQGGDKNGSGEVEIVSGLWMSTSAVTSLSFILAGNFTTDTTLALYGIKEFS